MVRVAAAVLGVLFWWMLLSGGMAGKPREQWGTGLVGTAFLVYGLLGREPAERILCVGLGAGRDPGPKPPASGNAGGLGDTKSGAALDNRRRLDPIH